eukprot:TRINITY_DN914_c0_g1_i5.p1 TRINITY_DN914_c0_g1~~TRINITY_DN914_c0_g1_i5.p1  ORF type:complete len:175 (+),score=31.63 TRINITY_DN914_c0_g1_i5:101-625(+)
MSSAAPSKGDKRVKVDRLKIARQWGRKKLGWTAREQSKQAALKNKDKKKEEPKLDKDGKKKKGPRFISKVQLRPLPATPISQGVAVGTKKGHTVLRRKRVSRIHRVSKRGKFVKELIREVAGFAPYERRVMELLKNGLDKRALKLAKKRVGSHQRAKVKREELSTVLRKARAAH